MSALSNLKDISAKQNGAGIYLSIGEHVEHLNWMEALALLETLTLSLPQLQNRQDLAWNLRHAPIAHIRAFWSAHPAERTVKRDRFRGEVTILDQVIMRTDFCPTEEAALAELRATYGDPELEAQSIIDSPGSQEIAQRKLIKLLAEEIAAAEGLTVAQLVARMKA